MIAVASASSGSIPPGAAEGAPVPCSLFPVPWAGGRFGCESFVVSESCQERFKPTPNNLFIGRLSSLFLGGVSRMVKPFDFAPRLRSGRGNNTGVLSLPKGAHGPELAEGRFGKQSAQLSHNCRRT